MNRLTLITLCLCLTHASSFLPECESSSHQLVVDVSGSCGGIYKCACIDDTCGLTSYCPCPFLYTDTSKYSDGSTCECSLANLCATTCPEGYYSYADNDFTCKRSDQLGTFDITLITFSSNSLYDEYFIAAAEKWESVITTDISNEQALDSKNSWFGEIVSYSQAVDDIAILYSVEYIDGVDQILGYAGPYYIRDDETDSSYNLPASGIMIFDSSDVSELISSGTFEEVVMHEMGHVLGFGTLWPTNSKCANSCYVYDADTTGACMASIEYKKLGFPDELYVEYEGQLNDGTYCSHWSEDQLDNELMTGYLGDGTYFPMSTVTIGAMADLGYQVDYSQADPLDQVRKAASSNQTLAKQLYPRVVRPQARGTSTLRNQSRT